MARQAVRVHALVLAAGQGRRFGGNKLLTRYQGRPLLGHVVSVVAAACRRGVVDRGHVVIASDDDIAHDLCIMAGLEPIPNDAPDLGLSRSLQLGLASLERLSPDDAGAALVFLGDQPLVRLEVVEQLVDAHRHHPAAVLRPRYQDRPEAPGHPTILDRSTWHLARHLQGDHGIAGLLTAASIETTLIDVPGDNPDIDTREDLLALEELAP